MSFHKQAKSYCVQTSVCWELLPPAFLFVTHLRLVCSLCARRRLCFHNFSFMLGPAPSPHLCWALLFFFNVVHTKKGDATEIGEKGINLVNPFVNCSLAVRSFLKLLFVLLVFMVVHNYHCKS